MARETPRAHAQWVAAYDRRVTRLAALAFEMVDLLDLDAPAKAHRLALAAACGRRDTVGELMGLRWRLAGRLDDHPEDLRALLALAYTALAELDEDAVQDLPALDLDTAAAAANGNGSTNGNGQHRPALEDVPPPPASEVVARLRASDATRDEQRSPFEGGRAGFGFGRPPVPAR